MKVLVAIINCHPLRIRQEVIRETWLSSIVAAGFDYKFFLGRAPIGSQPGADEVFLNVDDSYRGLPEKIKAVCAWALAHGYEFMFRCDDDVYVQGERLRNSNFAHLGDYIGRKRGPSGNWPAPYCSGFSYWLSAKAMHVLANAAITSDVAEDRHAGNTLLACGILAVGDYRYTVIDSRRNAVSHCEGPRKGNAVISACEFAPDKMRQVHKEWLGVPSDQENAMTPFGDFSRVCVLVKTFLRDGYLLKTVEGIQKNMRSAKIVIVDDGKESSFKISWYATLRRQGHLCQWMPFDSGFGAKANEGVKVCDRPYVLIASDDFNFDNPAAAEGVRKLVTVLDNDPTVSVASGRVNGNPYEATLELNGDRCVETKGYHEGIHEAGGVGFRDTDLTVNYSLVRREVFRKVKWDSDVKIGGGEHGAFYIDLKRAGFKVCYVPGVNINELRGTTDWQAIDYPTWRARARQPGRICLKRRGVNFYHLMGGGVETT